MIIKFALGCSSFKLFENSTNIFYEKEIWLPKEIWEVTHTRKEVDGDITMLILSDQSECIDEEGFGSVKEKILFNPKHSEHLRIFVNTLGGGYVCHVDRKPEAESSYSLIGHERVHQVKYNFIKFIQDGCEYNILSSFPVYICNNEGKTVETLRN